MFTNKMHGKIEIKMTLTGTSIVYENYIIQPQYYISKNEDESKRTFCKTKFKK